MRKKMYGVQSRSCFYKKRTDPYVRCGGVPAACPNRSLDGAKRTSSSAAEMGTCPKEAVVSTSSLSLSLRTLESLARARHPHDVVGANLILNSRTERLTPDKYVHAQ
jgi:hypothetical protein